MHYFPTFASGAGHGARPVKKDAMRPLKWMAMTLLAAGLAACDDFGKNAAPNQTGELCWRVVCEPETKTQAEIPDTNDFLLTIRDSDGKVLYDGPYGDSPASLPVSPGSYSVKVVSLAFSAPAFSRPQYGDEQVVVVGSGESVTVALHCTLLNAGIRLITAPSFLTSYPDGVLYVMQEGQRLLYGYLETRILYVKPGTVSVVLYQNGKDQVLLSRVLSERDILTLKISAPASGEGAAGVSVVVDTTRNWLSDSFVIGGDNDAQHGPEDAYSVADAAKHVGEEGVWVYGYIVGGDLTAAGKNVKTSDITKATHLALAARSSITVKASCVAVELPSGSVREALNLVSHPQLIGTRVYVKGNLVSSYFGTTGLKGCKEYVQK